MTLLMPIMVGLFLLTGTAAVPADGLDALRATAVLINERCLKEKAVAGDFSTGFVVRYREKNYLVAAKHAVELLGRNGKITAVFPKGETVSLPVRVSGGKSAVLDARWFFHASADLAVYAMVSIADADQCFRFDVQDEPQDHTPSEQAATYVAGFTAAPGVRSALSPSVEKVRIATTTTVLDTDFMRQTLRLVLLDRPLPSSFAGAPVFQVDNVPGTNGQTSGPAATAGKTRIVGIIGSSLSGRQGGKISSFVPVRYLREILGSAEFMEFQKK